MYRIESGGFYVLHFLKRPYTFLKKYIYVHHTSIIRAKEDNFVVFKYSMNNKHCCNSESFHDGRIILKTKTEKEARRECIERNNKAYFEDDDMSDSEDQEINKSTDSRKRKSSYSCKDSNKCARLISEDTENEPNVTEIDFDVEGMFETNIPNVLKEELILNEKQLTDLDGIKKLILEKYTLLKALVEKLQTYKNQNNDSNENEKYLRELLKQKDKVIAELKMKCDEKLNKNKTDIKPINEETNWTLKCNKDTFGAFELIPNSGVYVNGVALCYCLKYTKSKTELARMLLVEVFCKKALKTCTFSTLDKHAMTVLINFIEGVKHCKDVKRENIDKAITRQLYRINKILEFKDEKVKLKKDQKKEDVL